MASVREIKNGRQEQGADEEIVYTLTVPSTWGVPTGTPTVTAYSVSGYETYTDVTSTLFPSGTPSIAGQVITLPVCKGMTVNTTYRIEVKFSTTGGSIFEPYALIDCKR